MKLHRTAKALVARGISSDLAVDIANNGYTISQLKQLPDADLKKLGLNKNFVKRLKFEARPPIPDKILNELLFESKFCCCVCRDASRPIVVHHITPWEESHSHEKDILVVLCPLHHDEAHTKRELTLSLTPQRLRSMKESWLEKVKENDNNTILSIISANYACWDFFNLNRIFELSSNFKIDFGKISTYKYLLSNGYIDIDGLFKPIDKWAKIPEYYWLDMMHGHYISRYLQEVFIDMLPYLPIKILNNMWRKNDINAFCKPGDFIIVQGAFYFKTISKKSEGVGQIKLGYRKAQGIQIEFLFDAYYCTSASARGDHLCGRRVVTAFSIIREITQELGLLKIKCSVLALGSYFNDIYNGRFFTDTLIVDIDEEDFYEEN